MCMVVAAHPLTLQWLAVPSARPAPPCHCNLLWRRLLLHCKHVLEMYYITCFGCNSPPYRLVAQRWRTGDSGARAVGCACGAWRHSLARSRRGRGLWISSRAGIGTLITVYIPLYLFRIPLMKNISTLILLRALNKPHCSQLIVSFLLVDGRVNGSVQKNQSGQIVQVRRDPKLQSVKLQ